MVVVYLLAKISLLWICFSLTPSPLPQGRGAKKDGFIQMHIAIIQPQPAKMAIMLTYAISSGEGGFGSARTKIHFIGEKL